MDPELGGWAAVVLAALLTARWFVIRVVNELAAMNRRLARLLERRGIPDSDPPPDEEPPLTGFGRITRVSSFKIKRPPPGEK